MTPQSGVLLIGYIAFPNRSAAAACKDCEDEEDEEGKEGKEDEEDCFCVGFTETGAEAGVSRRSGRLELGVGGWRESK